MKTKKLTGLCSLFLLLMLIFSIPTPAQAAIGGPDLPTPALPPLSAYGLSVTELGPEVEILRTETVEHTNGTLTHFSISPSFTHTWVSSDPEFFAYRLPNHSKLAEMIAEEGIVESVTFVLSEKYNTYVSAGMASGTYKLTVGCHQVSFVASKYSDEFHTTLLWSNEVSYAPEMDGAYYIIECVS